jgi:hypothetical protein
MESSVMNHDDAPEISLGRGKSHFHLKGKEAFRAVGWPLQFVFIALGLYLLTPLVLAVGFLVRTWAN